MIILALSEGFQEEQIARPNLAGQVKLSLMGKGGCVYQAERQCMQRREGKETRVFNLIQQS